MDATAATTTKAPTRMRQQKKRERVWKREGKEKKENEDKRKRGMRLLLEPGELETRKRNPGRAVSRRAAEEYAQQMKLDDKE